MKKIIVFILCLIPWFIASLVPFNKEFYDSLILPFFTPPNIFYVIAWTITYILIAISNDKVYASIDINETEINEYINSKFVDKELLLLDTFKKDILNKSYIFEDDLDTSTYMDIYEILNKNDEDEDNEDDEYYDEDDDY